MLAENVRTMVPLPKDLRQVKRSLDGLIPALGFEAKFGLDISFRDWR